MSLKNYIKISDQNVVMNQCNVESKKCLLVNCQKKLEQNIFKIWLSIDKILFNFIGSLFKIGI